MRSGKAASAAATAVVSAVVASSSGARCRGLAVPVDASPLLDEESNYTLSGGFQI